MISKRTFRLTPTDTVFSYLPEILRKIGVKIEKQEHNVIDDRFKGLIEGSKVGEPSVSIRVRIEGWREPWTHVGGNFIRSTNTSHVIVETHETTREGHRDSENSLGLLKKFDSKISMYVWHTSG